MPTTKQDLLELEVNITKSIKILNNIQYKMLAAIGLLLTIILAVLINILFKILTWKFSFSHNSI